MARIKTRMASYAYRTPPPTLTMLYRGKGIAKLVKAADGYRFRYLSAFSEEHIEAIPGIPDPSDLKWREFDALPRFFKERIPDLSRPEIRALIERWHLTENNELELLAHLSSQSITDPFRFEVSAA